MSVATSEFSCQVSPEVAHSFVANFFGEVDLGHQSRNRCFQRVAEQLSRHPGGTLPEKLSAPNDYIAMDRLMNRPETTHAAVLTPHCQRTLEKMRAHPGVVLILHDTTELNYTGKKALGLPKIGNGTTCGYLCHNSLAVEPQQREVFGLVQQILHKRETVGKKEGVKAKRERLTRESRLWSKAVLALPAAPQGQRWVDVCDRGADLFEFLATEKQQGRACLVRSTHNRRVLLGPAAEVAPGEHVEGQQAKLHDYLRTLPAVGDQRSKEFYDRVQEKERRATLCVSFAEVQVLPPHVKRGEYEETPLRAWAVRVWEASPSEKGTKLE